MDARVALLLLWTVLVLLLAELKSIDAAEVYTNTWAVQINGGPGEAGRIAREHGFINHGKVSSYYLHLYCIVLYVCVSLYNCIHGAFAHTIGKNQCYKTILHQSV